MLIVPKQCLFSAQRHFSTQESDVGKKRDPNAIKQLRFSAFNKTEGNEKEYTVKDEWKKRVALT